MKDEKILENEILSDEELEKISGGDVGESLADMEKFASYGRQIRGKYFDIENFYNYLVALKNTFGDYGVDVRIFNGAEHNKYIIDGKEVSREDAWKHIEKQLKK